MARDRKMMIGDKVKYALDALRELQRTGRDVNNRLERDFSTFGLAASTVLDNKRKAAVNDQIKRIGTATADKLVKSEERLSGRLMEIDKSQYDERITMAERFRANWSKITAAAAAACYASYRLRDNHFLLHRNASGLLPGVRAKVHSD